jgi:hypothetical protein
VWPPNFPLHGSAATEVLRVDADRFKGENSHSIVHGNVATSWSTPLVGTHCTHCTHSLYSLTVLTQCTHALAGVKSGNVLLNASANASLTVELQLRDPANLDFRPRAGSTVSALSAGPYDVLKTGEWGPIDCSQCGQCSRSIHCLTYFDLLLSLSPLGSQLPAHHYWIPGRLEWRSSSPGTLYTDDMSSILHYTDDISSILYTIHSLIHSLILSHSLSHTFSHAHSHTLSRQCPRMVRRMPTPILTSCFCRHSGSRAMRSYWALIRRQASLVGYERWGCCTVGTTSRMSVPKSWHQSCTSSEQQLYRVESRSAVARE